eukprot:maker-scaffold_37-snap-gene-1.49-mRNA-1 protein AED:0.35 eAED:0.35 QI:0/0/0/0.71/1/1/7/0/568
MNEKTNKNNDPTTSKTPWKRKFLYFFQLIIIFSIFITSTSVVFSFNNAQAAAEQTKNRLRHQKNKVLITASPSTVPTSFVKPNGIITLQQFESMFSPANFADGDLPEVTAQILSHLPSFSSERKNRIRNMMKFAYSNYEKLAFGKDELQPISGKSNNRWGGHAVTLIDSLSTLWIMNLKEEFSRATNYIATYLDYNKNHFASFFETTIRDLGGLLSAFYLTDDSVFLELSRDLGKRLVKAFGKNKLPAGDVNLKTGERKFPNWVHGQTLLAEVGSFQLEFYALSNLTGMKEFERYGVNALDVLYEKNEGLDGLFPLFVNPKTGKSVGNKYSIGALGDSFYEYLLKVHIQGSKNKDLALERYNKARNGLVKHLLYKTQPSNLRFLVDLTSSKTFSKRITHLVCFTPGMFALGSRFSAHKQEDLIIAKQLMYGCYQFYSRSATGLSGDVMELRSGKSVETEIRSVNGQYDLRPETIESLYVLYQVTKHPIYRLWGAKILESIEEHCKTKFGYGSIRDAFKGKGIVEDSMESFFFAEVLKYLYLLFDDEPVVNLEDWVFNTEGHPFKRFHV